MSMFAVVDIQKYKIVFNDYTLNTNSKCTNKENVPKHKNVVQMFFFEEVCKNFHFNWGCLYSAKVQDVRFRCNYICNLHFIYDQTDFILIRFCYSLFNIIKCQPTS